MSAFFTDSNSRFFFVLAFWAKRSPVFEPPKGLRVNKVTEFGKSERVEFTERIRSHSGLLQGFATQKSACSRAAERSVYLQADPKGLRVNKVTEFGKVSASSSRSGFAVIVGYYKDSRHRNRRAHEPQKDQFIYKQTLSAGL